MCYYHGNLAWGLVLYLSICFYATYGAKWTGATSDTKTQEHPKTERLDRRSQYRTSQSYLGNDDVGAVDNRIHDVNVANYPIGNGDSAHDDSEGRERPGRHGNHVRRGRRRRQQSNQWQPYGRQSDVLRNYRLQNDIARPPRERPRAASQDIRPEDRLNAKRKNRRLRSDKPNIVVILTDDQDSELGSLNVMRKTLRILRDGGVTFRNSFVATPMCCPSRSSFLTGMYVHNHNVYTNNDNCSSLQWQRTHETRNFGAYLSNAGYRTGYFGKYLNEYNGTYIPPGWREWVGLVRNSRFYNYTVNFNGEKIRHGDNYYADYFTDLIANDSVTFLKQSKQYFPNRPVAMVLSVPAPHGPEDSAPQYQHMFSNNTSHRTPSWNHAPNLDHQWILANTGKMEPIHIAFTDILHRKRLQTLMSVDDLVHKVFSELRNLGELDNTYVIYTSDHGYHLGQFGLIKGKAMPYDFDVRVPLLVRGPGLRHGVSIENIVQNIDIAPTILSMAGIPVPDHMDGRSFLPLLDMARDDGNIYNGKVRRKKAWRDTVLLERGKLTKKNVKIREKLELKQMNRINKDRAMDAQCKQPQYVAPCKVGQKWECRTNEFGRLRLYKCRWPRRGVISGSDDDVTCRCPNGQLGVRDSRRKRDVSAVAPRVKGRRRAHTAPGNSTQSNRAMAALRQDGVSVVSARGAFPRSEPLKDAIVVDLQSYPTNEKVLRKCRVLANDTVECEKEVYSDFTDWRDHKVELNKIIQNYRQKLDELRGLRRYLRKQKPVVAAFTTTTTTTTTTTAAPTTTMETTAATTTTIAATTTITVVSPPSLASTVYNLDSTLAPSTDVTPQPSPDVPTEPTCICDNNVDVGNVNASLDVAADVDYETLFPDEDGDAELLGGEIEPDADVDEGAEVDKATEKVVDSDSELDYDDDNGDPKINARLRRLVLRYREEPDEQLRDKIRRLRKKQKKARRKHAGQQPEEAQKPDCNKSHMKCFSHDNDHWKTQPLWTSPRRDPACSVWGMECHRMDNDHWKTEPRWTYGPFCFCPNSANNTYWCLRTINDTHNFLYCEFITGFLSYYDLNADPWQLRNAIHDLHHSTVHDLHELLEKMKRCKGARECTHRTRGGMEVHELEKTYDNWVAMETNSSTSENGSGDVGLTYGAGEGLSATPTDEMYESSTTNDDGDVESTFSTPPSGRSVAVTHDSVTLGPASTPDHVIVTSGLIGSGEDEHDVFLTPDGQYRLIL